MICPDCKADNIAGADFCESCGHDLHALDHPTAEDSFTEHLMNDRLGELKADEVQAVTPGDPVSLAIHIMQRTESESVLVKEGDELVGILTERDVLLKAAGDKVDLNAIAVRKIMTADPVVLRDDDTLAIALHKMSIGGFRHIPLLTQGEAKRVVSIQNVFHHISAFIHEQPEPVA